MRRATRIQTALLAAVVLTVSPLRAQVSPSNLLSARILDACRAYDAEPGRWLALESDLMAGHAAAASLPVAQRKPLNLDPMPAYHDWRAASLSDADLVDAV